jgi:hypothetical protein
VLIYVNIDHDVWRCIIYNLMVNIFITVFPTMYKRKREKSLLTFVFTNVLCDWTPGTAVVKACNKETAINKLLDEFDKTKFYKEQKDSLSSQWLDSYRSKEEQIEKLCCGVRNKDDLKHYKNELSVPNYERIKYLLRCMKREEKDYDEKVVMLRKMAFGNNPESSVGTCYADRKHFEQQLRDTKPFVFGESDSFAFFVGGGG